jgi:hypothetical protein
MCLVLFLPQVGRVVQFGIGPQLAFLEKSASLTIKDAGLAALPIGLEDQDRPVAANYPSGTDGVADLLLTF